MQRRLYGQVEIKEIDGDFVVFPIEDRQTRPILTEAQKNDR